STIVNATRFSFGFDERFIVIDTSVARLHASTRTCNNQWNFAQVAECRVWCRQTAYVIPHPITGSAVDIPPESATSMTVRPDTGITAARRTPRRKRLTRREFFRGLTVDDRGHPLLRRGVVAAFQRRGELGRGPHVLPPGTQRLGNLLVAQVLLEQINVPAARGVAQVEDAPGIVVVDEHDGRDPVLGHRLHLHDRITAPGITRETEHGRALIRLLGTDTQLRRHPDAQQVTEVGPDRQVLVLDVVELPRAVRPEPPPHPMPARVGA